MAESLIVTMFATNGQSVRPPMYNSELNNLAAGWEHLKTWLAKMLEVHKCTARDLRRVTHNPDVANGIMGVVCWPAGPASPKVIIPDPSELMHMLNESTICPVLASLLGTEISVIPRPISPSGAAPFKRDPVCIWPHLTHWNWRTNQYRLTINNGASLLFTITRKNIDILGPQSWCH